MAEPDLDREEVEDADRERQPRREFSAAEAQDRLRAGKPLENGRVAGLCLRGEFPLPVVIRNCTLVRPTIDSALFRGEVTIVGSTLDRPTFSHRNEFGAGLNLSGSTLNKLTVSRAVFGGPVNLANARSRGKLFFNGCQFAAKVSGWDLCAESWVEFKNCTFAGDADLRSMHVDQGLILRACRFEQALLLRGANISKKLELTGSTCNGVLDLSKAKLHDYVYLEQIEQGPGQTFAFLNAVAERILIRPEQLLGRLASENAHDHTAAMQEYGLLKSSFQQQHRYDQEDWAYYRFKVNQRQAAGGSWLTPWRKLRQFADWLLLDLGCGYGTNPYRAVRAAGLIIVLFALIYIAGIEQFYVEKVPIPDVDKTAWPNRVLIGVMISVSVFISGLSGIRDLAIGWMNLPLVLESLLGTFLWGLFIVAFSRKVIR